MCKIAIRHWAAGVLVLATTSCSSWFNEPTDDTSPTPSVQIVPDDAPTILHIEVNAPSFAGSLCVDIRSIGAPFNDDTQTSTFETCAPVVFPDTQGNAGVYDYPVFFSSGAPTSSIVLFAQLYSDCLDSGVYSSSPADGGSARSSCLGRPMNSSAIFPPTVVIEAVDGGDSGPHDAATDQKEEAE